ncbi:MAG: HmuY family protein [Bacteroidota bacterium]|nr:HmuY family protein [Bacteroidota bacterium]
MRCLFPIFLLLLSLQSCFKEEDMIPPHEQGDLEEGQAGLGSLYENQVYFDLSENEEASSSSINDWDLSFESSTGGWIIRLNSAQFMLAGNSMDTLFSEELTMDDLEMKFDKSDGNPDSTAMAEWFEISDDSTWSNRYVYLVDRGSDVNANPLGQKKIQLDMLGEDFLLRYANPDNSGDTSVRIPRDPAMDQVYFSFDEGMVDIAPLPDQWSLLFTRYTTMLVTDEGEDYPYLVVGVLLNPNGVAAARDSIHDFMEMDRDDVINLEFTTRADVIGYDWKYYNFDAGVYTIVPDMNFVIRDRNGYFYKFRFVDFYNDEGVKGFPTFEFARL